MCLTTRTCLATRNMDRNEWQRTCTLEKQEAPVEEEECIQYLGYLGYLGHLECFEKYIFSYLYALVDQLW